MKDRLRKLLQWRRVRRWAGMRAEASARVLRDLEAGLANWDYRARRRACNLPVPSATDIDITKL